MIHYRQDVPSPVEAYESVFVPAMLEPLTRATMNDLDLQSGERLLDLACGTGVVARRVAPLLGGQGTIVAVDANAQMLAKARSLPTPPGAPIEWLNGDAQALDLPDASFDVVICQQGLQYFSNPKAAVRECRRTLTDGGRVFLSTWRSLEHAPLFEALVETETRHLRTLGVSYEELAAPFSMDSADESRALLETAGFAQITIREIPVEVRFPSAARFVEDVEIAYASLMPQFVEDPEAFEDFVNKVEHDMRPIVERHRDGDGVRFAMKAQGVTGRRPG